MQFVLASHNKKKLAELSAIVSSLGIEIIPLPEGAPEPEENGKTFEENAIIKAKSAAEFTGLPALADDSGLCVDALDGAPGIYSARYCEGTDEDRNAFLLKNMQKNRSYISWVQEQLMQLHMDLLSAHFRRCSGWIAAI